MAVTEDRKDTEARGGTRPKASPLGDMARHHGASTNNVRGPFIEYECAKCGSTVQESADYRDRGILHDRIVELNNEPHKRACASCGHN